MYETPILLVGAGPIGIEIAAELKRNKLSYLHIDAGHVASTIAWYAPGTSIFSSPDRLAIAGVPFSTYPNTKAFREEYLSYLRTVVSLHDLEIKTYHRLTSATCQADGTFYCRIGEEVIKAEKIILAIGDMHRPRLLGVPGEDLPNVSHFLAEPHQYFRQKVVIVGAKNSAAEAAVRLSRVEAKITICHRREDFDPVRIKAWLLPELRCLIDEEKISFLPNVEVKRIEAKKTFLKYQSDGSSAVLEHDRVLLLTGYEQDSSLFQELGVQLIGEGHAPRHNPETMETNVPGVFVAGTATAGTQIGGVTVFIENCHGHAGRIVGAITGKSCPVEERHREVESREI